MLKGNPRGATLVPWRGQPWRGGKPGGDRGGGNPNRGNPAWQGNLVGGKKAVGPKFPLAQELIEVDARDVLRFLPSFALALSTDASTTAAPATHGTSRAELTPNFSCVCVRNLEPHGRHNKRVTAEAQVIRTIQTCGNFPTPAYVMQMTGGRL